MGLLRHAPHHVLGTLDMPLLLPCLYIVFHDRSGDLHVARPELNPVADIDNGLRG